MNETFKSERAPEPVGAFPHAKRVGELLFLSGIGPRVRGSKEIPGVTLDSSGNVVSYDIETQCHAVFENVRLVLEDAGATWQDIVDVTVFLTDMKKDFPDLQPHLRGVFRRPRQTKPDPHNNRGHGVAHTDRDRAKSDRGGGIIIVRRFELTRFPTRSPLPFAALPSILLIPSARFTDWHRLAPGFLVPFSRTRHFQRLKRSGSC